MTQEKMNLWQKLLEVKKEIPYLKQDGQGYKYKYVTPEKVLSIINPILNEHGVFLKTEVKKVDLDEVKIGSSNKLLYSLQMLMTFVDTKTGETIECDWYGAGQNGVDQGYGTALTYAERYFMLKFFNIPYGENDPDKLKYNNKTQGKKRYRGEKQKVYEYIKRLIAEKKLNIDIVRSMISDGKKYDNLTEAESKELKTKIDEYIKKI